MIARLFAVLMLAAAGVDAQSLPTPPTPNVQSTPDLRGTNVSPVVVSVLPTVKTPEDIASEQAQREDQSSANWSMVRLTGVIVVLTLMQIFFNWLQATRLKETINKMDEIAQGQTADIAKSIAEASRAATAMEIAARAASESAETARQALYVAEAAEIQIAQIMIETPPGRPPQVVSTDCKVVLELRNFGRTRAIDMRPHWHFGIPGSTDKETVGQRGIDVSANGVAYLTLGLIGEACSNEQWEQVRTGKLALRFWGEEAYRDVFGRARRFKAEGTYRPPNGFSIDVSTAE